MRRYYFFLIIAIILDSAVWPWLWGASFMPSIFLATLPFGFLFLPARHLKIIFVLSLFYLRATTSFNLGVLFLSLILMLWFERWFLVNFFHRSAWQTLALSGLGVMVFYLTITSLSWWLAPAEFLVSWSLAISVLLSTLVGAGVSFLLNHVHN